MAFKKLFPIVVAGGALYYYDQNIDPIISRNFQTPQPVKQNSKQISKELNLTKDKVQSTATLIQKDIESKYNQLESKTTGFTNKWSSVLSEKSDEVNKLVQSTLNTKPDSSLRAGAASYLDFINHIGDTLTGKAKEAEKKAQRQQESYQNAWFSWGTGHKEKLAEAFDVEKARALSRYEQAKKQVDDLSEKFKDPKKRSPELEKSLQDAQKNFDSSLGHLKSYGQDVIDQANKELESAKNSWWKWGQSQLDKLQAEYDKSKSNANKQYEAAKKRLDDLNKQIKEKNPFKTKQEETDHLEAAKNDLNKTYEDLKKYGASLFDNVTK